MDEPAIPAGHEVVERSIDIDAYPARVWRVLTDPALFARWYIGMALETSWDPGSPIRIAGYVGAKKMRVTGSVRAATPPWYLAYDCHSPISGLPDTPENRSLVTWTLDAVSAGTRATIRQTVPPSPVRQGRDWTIGPESGVKHVAFWWQTTLPVLKQVAEEADGAIA